MIINCFLEERVTNRIYLIPATTHSSTMYCILGLSTIVNTSFGIAFVAGRMRVPSPATGITALVILCHSHSSIIQKITINAPY